MLLRNPPGEKHHSKEQEKNAISDGCSTVSFKWIGWIDGWIGYLRVLKIKFIDK